MRTTCGGSSQDVNVKPQSNCNSVSSWFCGVFMESSGTSEGSRSYGSMPYGQLVVQYMLHVQYHLLSEKLVIHVTNRLVHGVNLGVGPRSNFGGAFKMLGVLSMRYIVLWLQACCLLASARLIHATGYPTNTSQLRCAI